MPWIAGFSAPFVQDVISSYLPERQRRNALVLDPFAGVGTTLVETLKLGVNSVGYEINAYAALSAQAKVDCVMINPDEFQAHVNAFCTTLTGIEEKIDSLWAKGGVAELDALLLKLRCFAPSSFKSRIPFSSARLLRPNVSRLLS